MDVDDVMIITPAKSSDAKALQTKRKLSDDTTPKSSSKSMKLAANSNSKSIKNKDSKLTGSNTPKSVNKSIKDALTPQDKTPNGVKDGKKAKRMINNSPLMAMFKSSRESKLSASAKVINPDAAKSSTSKDDDDCITLD